jgi:DNA-binding CsgD family transcriptional regulator
VTAALAHVAAPTLLLQRKDDRYTRLPEAQFLAQRIAGAELVVLDGEDHWPFVGGAAAIVSEVQKFLRRVPSLPKRPVRRMPKPPRAPPRLSTLTRRQREILELLAQGRTNREIAKLLFRSEHTVHRHVANILAALGVKTRAQAAAIISR